VDDGHGRGIGVQRLGFPPEGCGLASGGDLTGAEKVRAQGQYGAVAEALGEQGGLIRGGRVRAPSGRHHPVARGGRGSDGKAPRAAAAPGCATGIATRC